MTRFRKSALIGCGLLASIGVVAVANSRTGSALLKGKEGFVPHDLDERVWVEHGAQRFGAPIARSLGTAVAVIEEVHGRPFKYPVTVFVCSSQDSLNEFLGLPPEAPIRGAVRFGKVYLAPSAFDWNGQDLHRESLLHELSHLHLRQRLGFLAYRGALPSWFHEGLADLVSGAGGEGIDSSQAIRTIRAGRTVSPDSTGRLWTLRRVDDSGLGGPMFHKQSRMFVGFLAEKDPPGFRAFLRAVQDEGAFAGPFRDQFEEGVPEMWNDFVSSLEDRDPTLLDPK